MQLKVATVSIIIIFLNAEKYLREAIESVFAQTFTDWELSLVDDGSTDGSTRIAKEFSGRYPQKVRYLEHEGHQNKGKSASHNLGISHTEGEFIAFLDADDVWFPEKLEKQVALLKQHPEAGLLANPGLYWYADGRREFQPMTLSPGLLLPGSWIPKILESSDNAVLPSTTLVRRELVLKVKGFEDTFEPPLVVFDDQVMWFKVALIAPLYYQQECLILYRVHAQSSCQSVPLRRQMLERVTAYSWLIHYLKRDGFSQYQSRGLLITLSRIKLCVALIELANRFTGEVENRGTVNRKARLRVGVKVMRSHGSSLGHFFSAMFLLNILSTRAAKVLSRGSFVFAKTAYEQNLLKAVKAFCNVSIRFCAFGEG